VVGVGTGSRVGAGPLVGQRGDGGVEQRGDLGDARGEVVELAQQHPGQLGVVIGEPAFQSFGQGARAGPGPSLGQLGERGGAAPPGDQRLDHRPARDPMDVGEHGGNLDQSILQQLLDPLLDPGAVFDQIETGPGQITHLAHRLGGHQRGRHHRTLGQLCQPHRVDLVRLRATRHVLGLRRIHQPHRQAGGFQQVVERAPVVVGYPGFEQIFAAF
jgi:hypothetical protein